MSQKEEQDKNIDGELKDQMEETLNEAIEEAEKNTSNQGETSEKEALKADLEKEKDKFLRLFAEFENYKRRTGKERVEMFKTAGQDIVEAMLPVLDDFDRALSEISKAKDRNLLKGVELIYNKFKETLRAKGMQVMEVEPGDSFDSEYHEAITQIPAPSDDLKGKIVDVVQKGYTMGDKIIRYPKVVTGK